MKKPKVAAVIAARMESTRLPGKVVAPIMGRPLLSWMIERVRRSALIDEIVVAIPNTKENDSVERLLRREKVKVFRGSNEDVLGRMMGAADTVGAEVMVRLTADCPLVDPKQIDEGVKLFLSGKWDFVANNHPRRTVPVGMDVEIVKVEELSKYKDSSDPTVHEHVVIPFYEKKAGYRVKVFGPKNGEDWGNLRLTVDTEADLELVRRVFRLLAVKWPEFGYEKIVGLFRDYPDLRLINSRVPHKQARLTGQQTEINQKAKSGFFNYQPNFRAAIAGCGRVASGYDSDSKFTRVSSHVGAYQTHPQVQLAAACDIDVDTRQRFLERWGEVAMYESAEKMLTQERIDILSVTTKPDQHYQVMLAAIKHGVRAIFCEKPFTDDSIKAKQIVDLCREKKILLMVDYNRRFDVGHQKLKAEADKLGRCLGGIMTYSNGWMNNGCHAVDLVRWLGGEFVSVNTIDKIPGQFEPDYTVAAQLESGGTVMFMPIPVIDYYQFGLELWFQKGKIMIEDQGAILKLFSVGKHPQISTINRLETVPKKSISGSPQSLPEAVGNLVRVLTQKEKPWSDGESALRTQKALSAVVESWKRKTPIKL